MDNDRWSNHFGDHATQGSIIGKGVSMKEVEKLRILIPHWIEHNEEHAHEFRRWTSGIQGIEEDILVAVDSIANANEALRSALEKLGGPLPHPHTNESDS